VGKTMLYMYMCLETYYVYTRMSEKPDRKISILSGISKQVAAKCRILPCIK